MSQVNVTSGITPESLQSTNTIAQLLTAKADREAQLASTDAQLNARREIAKMEQEQSDKQIAAQKEQQDAAAQAQADRDSKFQEFLMNRDARSDAARSALEDKKLANAEKTRQKEMEFLNAQAEKSLTTQRELAMLNAQAELAGAEAVGANEKKRAELKGKLEDETETITRLQTAQTLIEGVLSSTDTANKGTLLGSAMSGMTSFLTEQRELSQAVAEGVGNGLAAGLDVDDLPEGTKLGRLGAGLLDVFDEGTPSQEGRRFAIDEQAAEVIASRAVERLPRDLVGGKDALRDAIQAAMRTAGSPEERVFEFRKALRGQVPESVARDALQATADILGKHEDKRLRRLGNAANMTLDSLPHRLKAEKMEEILEDTFAGIVVSGDLRDIDLFVETVTAGDLPEKAKERVIKKVRMLEARLIGETTAALGRRGVEVDLSDGGLSEELRAAQQAEQELGAGLDLLESETATDVAEARLNTLLGP